jgi:hypothetical protein
MNAATPTAGQHETWAQRAASQSDQALQAWAAYLLGAGDVLEQLRANATVPGGVEALLVNLAASSIAVREEMARRQLTQTDCGPGPLH